MASLYCRTCFGILAWCNVVSGKMSVDQRRIVDLIPEPAETSMQGWDWRSVVYDIMARLYETDSRSHIIPPQSPGFAQLVYVICIATSSSEYTQ